MVSQATTSLTDSLAPLKETNPPTPRSFPTSSSTLLGEEKRALARCVTPPHPTTPLWPLWLSFLLKGKKKPKQAIEPRTKGTKVPPPKCKAKRYIRGERKATAGRVNATGG